MKTDFHVVIAWQLNDRAISNVEVDTYVYFDIQDAVKAVDHWKSRGWNSRIDTHVFEASYSHVSSNG